MQALQYSVSDVISVFLDKNCSPTLGDIFRSGSFYFDVTNEPATADLIVFGFDDYRYIRASELYKQHKDKCICVSETDRPRFFLPAIYSSNMRTMLIGVGRSETMNYPCSQIRCWNRWVTKLAEVKREKRFLYTFMGGSTSFARKRLFRHFCGNAGKWECDDVLIEATDPYDHWNDDDDYAVRKDDSQKRYAEVMAESKFVLCPRGVGQSSLRLFEAMETGVAPVIISDRWIPIPHIDWSFAIFVKERQIAELDQIIRQRESEWMWRGQLARKVFVEHFSNEQAPEILSVLITRLLSTVSRRRERVIHLFYPSIHLGHQIYDRMRWIVKYLILRTLYITGMTSPYRLNRPLEHYVKRKR
jgi:Exostosin family